MVGFHPTGGSRQVRSMMSTLATTETTHACGTSVFTESKARVKVPMGTLDSGIRGKEAAMMVALSYRENTGYIHIQCGAVIEDAAVAQLKALDLFYTDVLDPEKTGQAQKAPGGLRLVAAKLRNPPEVPIVKGVVGSASETEAKSESDSSYSLISLPSLELPQDPGYLSSVETLAVTATTLLGSYPTVRDDLLELLCSRYGLTMTAEAALVAPTA